MRTLISSGRLVDPVQSIDSLLDLVIEDGTVSAILPPERSQYVNADRVIDASGCVVSPGFIDIHMHEDPIGRDGHIRQCIFPAMLRMGVTTVLAGNCGTNLCDPLRYLHQVDQDRTAVNVAMMAGHTWFRSSLGQKNKYAPVSQEFIDRLIARIYDALEQGCMGISFGLRYVPGTTTEEFLQIASCAEKDHRLVSCHVRDDAAAVFDSVAEFAQAGRHYQIPLEVSHIGSMGGFGQMPRLLQQLDGYRGEGIDIAADCYPYYAFSTPIGEATYDDGWLDRYHCDYDVLEMCEGKYKGQRCTKEIFEEMRHDHPKALTVCYVMHAEDVHAAFRHPGTLVGSDGVLSDGQGHPRAAGTFPRFLAEFVRSSGDLSLFDAISRMTALPAQRMGLTKKGNLRIGSDADLVIFDPETISDQATFADPTAPPEGIRDVMIGGETAIRHGQVVNERLGRALRP